MSFFSPSPLARRADQPPSRPGCNLLLAVFFFFFCLRLFCLPFKEKWLPSFSQREQQFSVSVTSTVKSKPCSQAGVLLALSSKYYYRLPSSLVILLKLGLTEGKRSIRSKGNQLHLFWGQNKEQEWLDPESKRDADVQCTVPWKWICTIECTMKSGYLTLAER